jgi:hypothetical protein
VTTEGSHLDLAGKTVVVAGMDPAVVEIVQSLVRYRALVAIVSDDHELVAAATRIAEAASASIIGLTSDPTAAEVWQRNAPHIEQRLGPVDAAIAIGPVEVRDQVAAAFLPDMRRRHHGVFVEAGTDVRDPRLVDGVLHRCIRTGGNGAEDLATSVLNALRQGAAQD